MSVQKDLILRLQEFMEAEAHSCSMDFGCITPEYVYRMWGGTVPLGEIEEALDVCKKNCCMRVESLGFRV